MRTNNSAAIISSERNVDNVFNNYLKIGVICVICGLLFIYFGDLFASQTSYFSSDFDRYMPILIMGMGGIGVLSGAALPFLMKSQTKMYHLSVYNNHIEGKGMIISQGGMIGQILDFHENAGNISSVSTTRNAVIVNMKDGRKIQCPADNAEEIALVIREVNLHQ